MAVITIFDGSHCDADRVAAGVAERLGYALVGDDLLDAVADRRGVGRERLARTMAGPPPFLSRLTHEREKNVAYLREAVADLVRRDRVVLLGPASLLVPRGIAHVLRVCVIANLDHRVARAMERNGWSEKQALRSIHREDGQRLHWAREIAGRDPYDEALYDLLLAMQSATVDAAIDSICEIAGEPQLATTDASRRAADDFSLAARVAAALAPLGHRTDVSSDGGDVRIELNHYVNRLDAVGKQLEEAAGAVDGVRSASCVPGPGFIPPSLLVSGEEFERPSKILLVDDEREFVHTLSERLQARDLDAAVAYDGEEALSFVASDEPEVMVLDLKMPGIDGIEVLRRVKRDHPAVEVIILTGHGSKKEEEQAHELGAFAYLRKPVDIDLLTKTMHEAYRKIGRQPRPGSQAPEG